MNPRLPILVIDDEADMCWAMSAILQAEGETPVIAQSAAEALRLAHGNRYAAAFVDQKLPDADGLDLARQLAQSCPGLPCVLVTGYLYDDDESVQMALAAGSIRGFIGKPFLIDQVRTALRLARTPGGDQMRR